MKLGNIVILHVYFEMPTVHIGDMRLIQLPQELFPIQDIVSTGTAGIAGFSRYSASARITTTGLVGFHSDNINYDCSHGVLTVFILLSLLLKSYFLAILLVTAII